MIYNDSTPEVAEIGQIGFEGHVTPFNWYKHLRFDDGKPNMAAIAILSEIVYWYRPSVIRDESTGCITKIKKKFKADYLQRTYQSFADQFGFTKRQASDACKFLQQKGLIELILRTVTTDSGAKLGNVLFIRIIPSQIRAITFSSNPSDVETSEGLRFNVRGIALKRQTNTEITTEITTQERNPLTPFQGGAADAASVEMDEIDFSEKSPGNTPPLQKDDKRSNRKRPAAKTGTTGTRVRGLTTDQLIEQMSPELQDVFKKFWGWYCKFCATYDAEPGDKNSAASAFLETVTTENLEEFRKGTLAYAELKEQEKEKKGQAVGIPHCCRFVAGNKTSHPTPYWRATLEAISDASEGTNDFGAIHKKLLKEHLRDMLGEHPYTSDGSMALRRHINDLAGHVPDAYKDFNKRIEPFKRKYASFPDLDHFIEAGIRFNWLGLDAQEKAAYDFKVYPKNVLEVDYINL